MVCLFSLQKHLRSFYHCEVSFIIQYACYIDALSIWILIYVWPEKFYYINIIYLLIFFFPFPLWNLVNYIWEHFDSSSIFFLLFKLFLLFLHPLIFLNTYIVDQSLTRCSQIHFLLITCSDYIIRTIYSLDFFGFWLLGMFSKCGWLERGREVS